MLVRAVIYILRIHKIGQKGRHPSVFLRISSRKILASCYTLL